MVDFWLILAQLSIILLTAFLAWLTYQSNLLLKRFRPETNLLTSPPELLARIVLVGVCLLLAWLTGLPAAQLGLTLTDPLRQVGLGLAAGVGSQIAVNWVTWLAIGRYGPQIYSPQVVLNILPRRPLDWLLVPLAFIPAVAMEELLFRALWLGGFGGLVPWPLLLIGLSLVFGLMHAPQGMLGMALAGALNVLLSLLFLWTGSIFVPLLAHYTINLLQVVVAYYQKDWLAN
jgi:uncharacterized protein